jgi:hypothetical protein
VNQLPYHVGQNLYDAHGQISRDCPAIYLWLDAISISQTDTAEKNNQVGLMGRIFSSAENVFCWLGREDQHTLRAVEFMKLIYEMLGRVVAAGSDLRSALQLHIEDERAISLMRETSNGRLPIEGPPPSRAHWQAFLDLCKRRYFTRLWIVQEYGLAKDPVFLCGSHSFSWRILSLTSMYATIGLWVGEFLTKYGLDGSPVKTLNAISAASLRGWDMDAYRQTHLQRKNITADSQTPYLILTHALAMSPMFRAFDAHDRIYALLGLALYRTRPPGMLPIQPRYETNVSILFREVASVLTLGLPTLMCLAIVEDRTVRKTPDLPSWVPDFNLQEDRGSGSNTFAKLCAGVRPDLPGVLSRSIDGSRLSLQGTFVDSIEEYANPMPTGRYHYPRSTLRRILELVQCLPLVYEHTAQDRLEALWRTLVWDMDQHTDSRAAAMTGECFPQWLGKSLVRHSGGDDLNWDADETRALTELLLSMIEHSTYADSYLAQSPLAELRAGKTHLFEMKKQQEFDLRADVFLKRCHFPCRKLMRTSTNYLGLCLPSAERGDQVWILSGGRLPVILRPLPESDTCEYLGEAFVHGISFGEYLQREPTFRVVTLV